MYNIILVVVYNIVIQNFIDYIPFKVGCEILTIFPYAIHYILGAYLFYSQLYLLEGSF